MPETKTTKAVNSKGTATAKNTAKKSTTPSKASTTSKTPTKVSSAKVTTTPKTTKSVTESKKTSVETKKTTSTPVRTTTPVKQKETISKGPKKESKARKDNKKKVRLITILSAIGFVALLVFVIVIIFSVRSCTINNQVYSNPYKTTTKVDYETEYLGTVKRNIPEVKNEELPAYPKYGSSLNSVLGDTEEALAKRNALITEAWNLASIKTLIGSDGYPKNTWDRMDKDGNLYLGDYNTSSGPNTPDKLYKHSSSVGLYLGDISDDEPGVVKRITMGPRGYDRGYGITGLYAPAGEVVKVEMSKEDMEATGGIIIHIGQALYNSKANNIWLKK
ncbi:MAG: hypothetical protein K2O23_01975, partial [Anaeroplasmataceae bacterium]|nr:hypothetical protein [Anaeroplasmataceae bacterium]